jgi:hypothetical protein
MLVQSQVQKGYRAIELGGTLSLYSYPAEPRTGADALQLTLRFSFQARLTASVRLPCKEGCMIVIP